MIFDLLSDESDCLEFSIEEKTIPMSLKEMKGCLENENSTTNNKILL